MKKITILWVILLITTNSIACKRTAEEDISLPAKRVKLPSLNDWLTFIEIEPDTNSTQDNFQQVTELPSNDYYTLAPHTTFNPSMSGAIFNEKAPFTKGFTELPQNNYFKGVTGQLFEDLNLEDASYKLGHFATAALFVKFTEVVYKFEYDIAKEYFHDEFNIALRNIENFPNVLLEHNHWEYLYGHVPEEFQEKNPTLKLFVKALGWKSLSLANISQNTLGMSTERYNFLISNVSKISDRVLFDSFTSPRHPKYAHQYPWGLSIFNFQNTDVQESFLRAVQYIDSNALLTKNLCIFKLQGFIIAELIHLNLGNDCKIHTRCLYLQQHGTYYFAPNFNLYLLSTDNDIYRYCYIYNVVYSVSSGEYRLPWQR